MIKKHEDLWTNELQTFCYILAIKTVTTSQRAQGSAVVRHWKNYPSDRMITNLHSSLKIVDHVEEIFSLTYVKPLVTSQRDIVKYDYGNMAIILLP